MSLPAAASWLAGVGADAVLGGQGADPSRIRGRSPRLIAIAERAARDGAALLEPRVAWRVLSIRRRDSGGVRLEDGNRLTGALIASRLAGAAEAAVVVATLGERLERRIGRLVGLDLPYAFALDGFGSAALAALAEDTAVRLAEGAREAGGSLTRPVSPGGEGFDLAHGQREIFEILGDGAAGVTRWPTGLMTPRHSVSLVYGIGQHVADDGVCDPCAARSSCRFRSLHAPAG
jgi:hypothetical protein